MTEKNEYLYDDYTLFLNSKMFLGSDAYGNSKIHPWYRYLYICRLPYSFEKIEHKIGITNNLRRRRDEIQRDFDIKRELGSHAQVEMVWVWSMPYPEKVELAVKRFLKEFIEQLKDKKYKEENIVWWPDKKRRGRNISDSDSDSESENVYESDDDNDEGQIDTEKEVLISEGGYTEIINGVAIIPLILYVRLIILYVYLHEKYIPNVPNILMKLEGILGGTTNLIINTLKYRGIKYRSLWSTLRRIEIQAIKIINAQTKSKIKKNKKEESKDDILKQIGNKITQLIGQRDETERVCDIEQLYKVLSIDINYDGIAFQRYKTPFKFKKHEFQHDYNEIHQPSNKKISNNKKTKEVVTKAYDNSIPIPSRKSKITKNEILYVSMKVDFEDNTPSIYRFFPAKILNLEKRKNTIKVRLVFLYPDLKTEYNWKKDWWKFNWKDERQDFRDCPNDDKYKSLWGLWTGTEPTTTTGNLEQLNINYKPYQNQQQYEQQEKKKETNKKKKKNTPTETIIYDNIPWKDLRKMAKDKDVLNVDGKSSKEKIIKALQQRDKSKSNKTNNDTNTPSNIDDKNATSNKEQNRKRNYVQYMMKYF